MRIALLIVSFLFGGLSLLAAVVQIKTKGEKTPLSAFIMIAGALILFAAAICNIAKAQFDYIASFIGCAAICAAAIGNGVQSGQLHIRHHVIRIALSVIVTVGFAFL